MTLRPLQSGPRIPRLERPTTPRPSPHHRNHHPHRTHLHLHRATPARHPPHPTHRNRANQRDHRKPDHGRRRHRTGRGPRQPRHRGGRGGGHDGQPGHGVGHGGGHGDQNGSLRIRPHKHRGQHQGSGTGSNGYGYHHPARSSLAGCLRRRRQFSNTSRCQQTTRPQASSRQAGPAPREEQVHADLRQHQDDHRWIDQVDRQQDPTTASSGVALGYDN